MTNSEKLISTLDFNGNLGEGAVLETFMPWDLTIDRWCSEGLPKRFASSFLYPEILEKHQNYLNDTMALPVYEYEQFLGFDGMLRMAFRIPFACYKEEVLEITPDYVRKRDTDGWIRDYYVGSDKVVEKIPPIRGWKEWTSLKELVLDELGRCCTTEKIEEVYGKYRSVQETGTCSIRFRVSGFFWTPRTLLGIEQHLMAFYDEPELINDINSFTVKIYKKYLDFIFNIIQPEVILLEEDLSGCNGPMISPETFSDFLLPYYRDFFPFLKEKGVKNIFIDTDGDFNLLIPLCINAGVDGFLPMDVNAGMDIVEVRKNFPKLKFIGGFNKLKIAQGEKAIDEEFQRLLPVIRQGGYVPGCDHQVAPSTEYKHYVYYIRRLKEIMNKPV